MNKLVKDALFGVVGGIAGTFVLGQVMGALSKTKSEEEKNEQKRLVPEPPTEKLARKISETMNLDLEKENKAMWGQVVHWGYGAFWGGVYGVVRKQFPELRWGLGLPFGIAFGLFGPAIMLPIMDLTPGPTEFTLAEHGRGLVAHYCYAAAVEGVCQVCEKIDQKMAHHERKTRPELRRAS